MIVRFHVTRKDNGANIAGAKVTLEKGENVGITDAQGIAEIATFWSGNLMYTVEATGYDRVSGTVQVPSAGTITLNVALGAAVAPGQPPPTGEEVTGTVGTSCDLLRKSMYGRIWHAYRNRYTGMHSNWDDEYPDVVHSAETDPLCFAPPPPPPKTVDEVSKEVDILRGTIQGVSSRINDLVTSLTEGFAGVTKRIDDLQKDVLGIWDKLEAWLIERIVAILLKGLDREVEKEAKK